MAKQWGDSDFGPLSRERVQQRVYDVFEVLPGGSPLWRGIVEGADNLMPRLIELAAGTKREFFALYLETGEIMARINAGNGAR